ncbi:Maf family nucleotide pyrophosphatase [bacterium]|nr:Maf family nucleotide pyrophosphatase [Amylibacter sp.]MDC1348548.1 Maf family nucleotide pyrophosphatase [Amylibacter sp.]MDC1400230.1 Maf family nucleotide pyrophosphatase [bacterium]
MKQKIILASESQIRKKLLLQAEVNFQSIAAKIDEDTIKESLKNEGAKPKDISDALAEYKAIRVANKFPTDLIIGCDQILVCDNEIISKARTLNDAKETLKLLRGKSHQLLSSVVIYDNNKPVWRTTSRAQLFMRDFTDEYLEYYIKTSGTDILSSVGCYLLENNGVNLFNRIQGDYFTVLGFPLLEVLDFLRKRELIKT